MIAAAAAGCFLQAQGQSLELGDTPLFYETSEKELDRSLEEISVLLPADLGGRAARLHGQRPVLRRQRRLLSQRILHNLRSGLAGACVCVQVLTSKWAKAPCAPTCILSTKQLPYQARPVTGYFPITVIHGQAIFKLPGTDRHRRPGGPWPIPC